MPREPRNRVIKALYWPRQTARLASLIVSNSRLPFGAGPAPGGGREGRSDQIPPINRKKKMHARVQRRRMQRRYRRRCAFINGRALEWGRTLRENLRAILKRNLVSIMETNCGRTRPANWPSCPTPLLPCRPVRRGVACTGLIK